MYTFRRKNSRPSWWNVFRLFVVENYRREAIMYKPKKFTNTIETEQGVSISIVAEENVKTDWNKPCNNPENERPDGTYNIVVDLSESDKKKLNHSITIKLPCGGSFEFGLDMGWFNFKDEYSNDCFYMEYNKNKPKK